MAHDCQQDSGRNASFAAIISVLVCSFLLWCVELIAQQRAASLLILSDAVHLAGDVLGLIVTLFVMHYAQRPADWKRTYGYVRLESFGGLINALLSCMAGIWISYHAIRRFQQPHPVPSNILLYIAALSFFINVVSLKILHGCNSNSLTVRGAYLEVLGDMIGAGLMLLSALLIRWTQHTFIDPLFALSMSVWIIFRSLGLFKDSANVLLEGAPDALDVARVASSLQAHPLIVSIHDLHIWALASNTPALTVHIVIADIHTAHTLHRSVGAMLAERFGIEHVTIQIEPYTPHSDVVCAYTLEKTHAHPQAE